MQDIFADNLVYAHYGLILALSCGQLLVLYALSNSNQPPAGLGLFTVYFMTTLLAWFAVSLNQVIPVGLDIPAVAAIISACFLALATSQRAGVARAHYLLGPVCLGTILAVFLLPPDTLFQLYLATAALFWAVAAALGGWRGWRGRNIGDSLIALAGLLMTAAMLLCWYLLAQERQPAIAQSLVYAVHGAAHALVIIGFLASTLQDQQHQLSHLSTVDPLTRLLNRRGLESALNVTLANARRHGEFTAAVMVDIDHFAELNRHFGEDTGDRILQYMARGLEQECRSGDVVARYERDVFLIILPNSGLEAARNLAERIRSRLGNEPLIIEQQLINVTASLGAAASGDAGLDVLYRDTTRALQLAKRGGRNRVAAVEHRPLHLSNAATLR
ncbi:GGDEF domain-containing protein [Kineobactrum salinum]|uniref:diguanylate cyclase n=1 Tax=Kineobactrum salinum TaxID=2708301 RepID=A0A6C0U3K5_9GAMM|nr:GGDEF domain-containing protein [Kineobactrum salinum]QIB66752.1 GGDEF domain-containing protein [Kineobactrum salinum]